MSEHYTLLHYSSPHQQYEINHVNWWSTAWTAGDGYKQYPPLHQHVTSISDAYPASYRVRRVQLDVSHSYISGVALLRDWDSYVAFEGPLFSGGGWCPSLHGKHHTPSTVSLLHLSFQSFYLPQSSSNQDAPIYPA